jgi:hypothetical protein
MTLPTRLICILVAALGLPTIAGCPEERKEAVEHVGGAPKRTIDDAQMKADAAEDKLFKAAKRADDAATTN